MIAADVPEKVEQGRRLVKLLRPGKAGVRSSYDLASSLGVAQRSVGFIVSAMRREGELIGSVHGSGYYLITTEEELQETMDHIESRKRGIDATLDALATAWMDLAASDPT